MIRALYSAASGMNAQQLNVDNISHNLANANTVGYKTRRAQFQDLVYQSMIQPGAAAGAQASYSEGLQVGLGARAVTTGTVLTQGNATLTNSPTDLAIQGKGFFQVRRPTGEIAFTRAGNFQLNRDGNIVTPQGDFLEPQITIPPEAQNVTVAADGTVSFVAAGQPNAQIAGQIQLANFANPAGLNHVGGNLLMATDASGEPVIANPGGAEGLGTLLQGYTEASNVSVVEEFINLIVAQRAYEANSRVVRAADEMYSQVNNLTR
jgi:flagellar basal-body rod protein FlgG